MVSTALNLNSEEQVRTPALPGILNLPHVEKTFWRGMPVYSYEDPATNLYVVLKGRVKIVRSSAEGEQKIIGIRYRGDLFGDLALAANSAEFRRSEEAVALDTARIAIIRVSDFWNAVRRDPALMQNAIQLLAMRLVDSHSQIESLVFDNNHRRLARALLALANDAALAGESSVRLTHEELAELIGSTREVVTGMMIEFRQRGLIEYKRGDIRPDLVKLNRFLAEERLETTTMKSF